MKTVSIGSAVKIKDEFGVERNALVTNCWPATAEYDDSKPVHLCINVVFVVGDEARRTATAGRRNIKRPVCTAARLVNAPDGSGGRNS